MLYWPSVVYAGCVSAIGNNRRSNHWRQTSGYEWQSGTNFTLYLIFRNSFIYFKENWQEISTEGVLSQVCLFWPNPLKDVSLAGKICTRVNNYGLLEMKGETRWLGMSVFICGLSEHVMNASDSENVIANRCTK